VPLDVNLETEMDATIRPWLSFGKQKLEELSALKAYFSNMEKSEYLFKRNQAILDARKIFQRADEDQKTHAEKIDGLYRKSPFKIRQEAQKKVLGLPLLPTTTIGSFPQTKKVRSKRFGFNKGRIPSDEYFTFLKGEIERTIRIQEELDLDVLVHGEFERNDMVQYFAEQLEGFAFTQYGWVQSYGSRCVRPPIIFKQIRRIHPMTIEWIEYAQSLTPKPVKGMLTGPVTILQWSFVRDDQLREITCREIAFAVREEVLDLEKAGIKIIQIDEPAFREGLPINKKERENYLRWAVNCFRIASGGVRDDTQIHTHMCYSEFNEMMDSIALMDADVISIEASRSKMELLNAFTDFEYPNEIGPGVYDIHSPGIPEVSEIAELIRKALQVIPSDRLWINPDCGLKTRQWEEVIPSLTAMVNGAKTVRIELSKG
jgi:5-methyltetrahydropteroyltriglutamate--homocysteine methyltransferase